MKFKNTIVILIVSLTLCLSAAMTVFFFTQEMNRPRLLVLGRIQDFSLTDSTGDVFHSSQLKGKVWVADFIFSTCADLCPMMSKNMAALHRSFQGVSDVDLVSITVNPEVDTPEVLAQYAKRFNAQTHNWHFLTGPRDEIQKIAVESFKLGAIEDPVFHSSYFSLIDRYGYLRGYYDGSAQKDRNRLLKDIARLRKEK